ncbi:MAG TPA: rRNA maturation RNase YbeY [Chloroflexota bacterium]|nr:rRNA maturation RNase YbeY [Chloroflexota bacterium]
MTDKTMTYNVEVIQKAKVVRSIVTAVSGAASETLRHERVKTPATVSILLTTDEQLQQLNRDFRGIDAPTDVLSFPAEKLPLAIMGEEDPYLGDIAISVPMAQRQAKESGHTLKDELQLLTIHGTLHLLGHDHEEPEEKKVMWWAQNSILAQIGAEITSPE